MKHQASSTAATPRPPQMPRIQPTVYVSPCATCAGHMRSFERMNATLAAANDTLRRERDRLLIEREALLEVIAKEEVQV